MLAANAEDIAAGRAKGLSEALLDRLLLNEVRLAALAADTRRVATLPDPVGVEYDGRVLPNGCGCASGASRSACIGVIYEARPNVTIDIATLCLKTGNAVDPARGQRDAAQQPGADASDPGCAGRDPASRPPRCRPITDPDRALVTELLRLDKYVDMIIPRGGAALHRLCREQATIPVITGGMGICHVFVDESADLARAVDIVENAKVQRPSVCNALDTVLVHRAVAAAFLPAMAERLARSKVELRATPDALAILQGRRRGAGRPRRPGRLRHRVDGADPGREDRRLAG